MTYSQDLWVKNTNPKYGAGNGKIADESNANQTEYVDGQANTNDPVLILTNDSVRKFSLIAI